MSGPAELYSWVPWPPHLNLSTRIVQDPRLTEWLSSTVIVTFTRPYDLAPFPYAGSYARRIIRDGVVQACSLQPHRNRVDNLREVLNCPGVLGYIALAACIYNHDLQPDVALRRVGAGPAHTEGASHARRKRTPTIADPA